MTSQDMTNTTRSTTTSSKTPYRQIRALYDDETITVYQAYNTAIASAAVAAQKLDASPLFSKTRMTWIKPSWAWMLYRAGYSYKDPGQARILALKLKHADFLALLEQAVLTHGQQHRRAASGSPDAAVGADDDGEEEERTAVAASASASASASTAANNERRQRQTEWGKNSNKKKKKESHGGNGGAVVNVQWDPERTVRLGKLEHRSIQIGIRGSEWTASIVGVEDVTDKARELKRVLDEDKEISHEELVRRGLVPVERPFEVSEELQEILQMNGGRGN